MEVIIAPRARRDIITILTWTQENFGPQTSKRYAKLIATAIEDLAAAPNRPGTIDRPEIAENCRTYHLFHSRNRAGPPGSRIRGPRHLLLYRLRGEGVVEIGRVLHDSMDLTQHLPEEYRG